MNKLILSLLFLFVFLSNAYADNFTSHYRFIIPDEGDRDWLSQISNDIITIDSALNILSRDSVNRVSQDAVLSELTADIVTVKGMSNRVSDINRLNVTGRLTADIVSFDEGYVIGVLTCDTVSIDVVSADIARIKILTVDSAIMLNYATTTSVGGVVGRISVITRDASGAISTAYIPIYSAS